MIPVVDLAARHARVAEALEPEVLEVLRSGWYVGGPQVEALEGEVAAMFGASEGIALNSGTDALVLGLQALGVEPGDEVIVPAVSFIATASSVLLAGAVPVIVDVLPDRPLIDPEAVKHAITSRTRAIVPVHLFGSTAHLPDLGLPVLDDAAQAVGGAPSPMLGIGAAISFYPTKVLGAAGDGGMLVTSDPTFAARVRSLANHGTVATYVHDRVAGHVGTNSRLDAIQAAVLRAMVPLMDADRHHRQSIARTYDAAFGTRAVPWDEPSNVSIYCLRHPRRDALREHLTAAGVGTAIYYPRPFGDQPLLEERHPTPNAEAYCRECLALPCLATQTPEQTERVVQAVLGFDGW